MVPSSILCRAQETLHRRRAADSLLENVRIVAAAAATAWGHEAEAAERRERRHKKGQAFAESAAAGLVEPDGLVLLLSENPDRIMAGDQDEAIEDRLRHVPA
jgi:hypothetical protein